MPFYFVIHCALLSDDDEYESEKDENVINESQLPNKVKINKKFNTGTTLSKY